MKMQLLSWFEPWSPVGFTGLTRDPLAILGVLFVTYISNSLSNFALLEIDVSICLTLTSIGPIYSLPVGYITKKDPITARSVVGSVLSVIGIFVLVH